MAKNECVVKVSCRVRVKISLLDCIKLFFIKQTKILKQLQYSIDEMWTRDSLESEISIEKK